MIRWRCLVATLALSGCGGEVEPGDGGVDCTTAGDGTSCGAAMVCAGGSCVASACGDGVLDTMLEECDDGNEVAFDGCSACRYDCASDTACDDGDPCNGVEECDIETHGCEVGTPMPQGTICSTDPIAVGVCRMLDDIILCVPLGCGNFVRDSEEQCDDGANGDNDDGCRDDCTYTCLDDRGCDDGSVCTGAETCVDHVCVEGTMLDCDDADDCTENLCSDVSGCANPIIDLDGDGHASTSIGACGDDCDDGSRTIYGGANELCDVLDNDCDLAIDETATFWYPDCDRDGYAASAGTTMQNCNFPITSPASCPSGSWTNLTPADLATTDCDDARLESRPTGTDTCNRFDDDCDALIDENVVRYSLAGDPPSGDSLSSSGVDSVIAAWNPLRREVAVVTTDTITGGTFGNDETTVTLHRLTAGAAEIGTGTELLNTSSSVDSVQVLFDGTDYVVAANVQASNLSLFRVDAATGVRTTTSMVTNIRGPTVVARFGATELAIVWSESNQVRATRASLASFVETAGARITNFGDSAGGETLSEPIVAGTASGAVVLWRRYLAPNYTEEYRTWTSAATGTVMTLGPDRGQYAALYDSLADEVLFAELDGTVSPRPIRLFRVDPATGTSSSPVMLGTTTAAMTAPVQVAYSNERGQIGVLYRDADPRPLLRRQRTVDGAEAALAMRVDTGFDGAFLGSPAGPERFMLLRLTTSVRAASVVCSF